MSEFEAQCWICPACKDDHQFGGPCTDPIEVARHRQMASKVINAMTDAYQADVERMTRAAVPELEETRRWFIWIVHELRRASQIATTGIDPDGVLTIDPLAGES